MENAEHRRDTYEFLDTYRRCLLLDPGGDYAVVNHFLSPVWESIEGKVYCPKCAGVLMSGFREEILCRAMEIMKDILDKEMEYGRAMEKKYILSSVIEQWFLAFKR